MKKDLDYIKHLLRENEGLKKELEENRTKEDLIKKIYFLLKIKKDLNLYRLNWNDLRTLETAIGLIKYSQTKPFTSQEKKK